MDPARIRLAACRTCARETEHVDIWCHSRTNGGTAAIVVQMLMCLTCWTRREP
jgi:hypothetical protein